MRQGPNGRRPRGRHHGGGGGGPHQHQQHQGSGGNGGGNSVGMRGVDNRPRSAASLRHQTFDSNCIDVRVRGNAWQVYEKYQALARDAQSAGDRVSAENYLQHAEHYFRIIEVINEATAAEQRARGITPSPPGFGGPGQPEIPQNYYGAPDGQQSAPQPAANGDAIGNVTPLPTQQAEVQTRNPPPANPFFAEGGEEQGGPEALAVRR